MNRKKLLSLALAGILSLSLYVPALADDLPEWPEAGQPTETEWVDPSPVWAESTEWMDAGDDVPAEDSAPETPVQPAAPWYAEAQQHVIEQGIMSGTTEGFDPLGIVTRVVAFHALWNMEGTPARKDFAPFSDVPQECWYQESAAWAQEAGITQGDGAGHYNPQWTITRAELATAFYRYAQFRGQDMTVTDTDAYLSYSDALSVPDYASDALRWAVDRGILNGKVQNGVLCLDFGGEATRAELATMLMRLDRLLNTAV